MRFFSVVLSVCAPFFLSQLRSTVTGIGSFPEHRVGQPSLPERGPEGSASSSFSQFCLSELSIIASPDSGSKLPNYTACFTPDTPTDVVEENTPSFGILK